MQKTQKPKNQIRNQQPQHQFKNEPNKERRMHR